MNVCYVGAQTPLTRNKILIKGLRLNGVNVNEIIMPQFNKYHIPLNYLRFLKKYILLHERPDVIYLSFSGIYQMPLVKLISKITDVSVVLDSFISLYDTYVSDRKLVKEGSMKAKGLFCADKYSCELADVAVLDTFEHIKYFCSEFGLDETKFRRIFVGADDDYFSPQDVESSTFNVKFYGTFIPVHGIEFILKAANLLKREKDIEFEVLGNGQTYAQMTRIKNKLDLHNLTFKPPAEYDCLASYLSGADLSLGLFGVSDKVNRAIPTKYYESIAMRKAVITSETPAMREFAEDYKHVLFCKKADEKSLAEKILELRDDDALRSKIGRMAYDKYKRSATPKALGRDLKKVFLELL